MCGGIREEQPDRRVELLALLEVEIGVDRVDGDVDRAPVRLELEDAAHHLGGRAADLAAEGVEVLEVRLEERVADDLDVHLVDVLEREAVAKVRPQRRVDQHHPVQVRRALRDAQRRHRVEHAWMVKRSEIVNLGGLWLEGHGLPEGSEVLGRSS